MISISLQPVPSQSLQITLNGQNCTIRVYYKWTGLFVDVLVNNAAVVTSRIARNGVPIVRKGYTGFIGDLYFIDTQGIDDPRYDGLGSRWFLTYE
jgi:hypothetical protein